MEFLQQPFYGNRIQDWIVAALIIVGSLVLGKVFYWLLKNVVRRFTGKTKTKIDDIVVDMLEEPLVMAVGVGGFWLALRTLGGLAEGILSVLRHGVGFLVAFIIAWALTRLLDAVVEEYLVPIVDKSESDLDDQLLPIVRRGVKVSIWVIAAIVGANNAGYDVGAVLAGLGIGGLAFALAAQDTVSNLFGGFTIFLDKPFTIGDRVKVQGYDGMILEIGLRSTRLATLEGRVVTIPNKKFTDDAVENVSSEPSRKVVLNIGLTYDTDAAGLRRGLDLLRGIAEAHPAIDDKVLTGFTSFGDFALGLMLIYYIRPGEDILTSQTEINLAVLERFSEAGLDMAFPTQTVYHQALPDTATHD